MGVVGVDVEDAVALIDFVLHPRLARAHQNRGAKRIVGGDQPHFARLMIAGADHQPLLVGGQRRADAKALVILVVQFDIAGQRLAEPVQPGIVGAPVLVGQAVDQRLVARDPDQRRQRAGDLVGQHLAGGDHLDPRGEAFRAVVIHRPGEQPPILADGNGAELEIFEVPGQRDFIEDQLIGAAVIGSTDRTPPPFLVFGAFLIFDPVEPVAVLLRNRSVGFLDAAAHFGEQALDCRLLRRHARLEPGVFGLQMRQHRRIVHLGIAGIAQPGIVVGHGDAMMRDVAGPLGGDGGSDRRCGSKGGICHRQPL